ncbi:MAG: response regulator [Methylococcales bacterium]|nr:response regulator [Methylococcales bacterium]
MIAIVDDDVEIAEAIGVWVQMIGIKCTVHHSAESLIDWIDQFQIKNSRSLYAAILDINLPGINGLELGKQLRSSFPDLVIVMVSALRHEEINNLGTLPSNAHLLRKPYDLDELEGILSRVA